MMLIGIILAFGAVEGIPFWKGLLLFIGGVALGRAVGDFLRVNIHRITAFRISAVIFGVFIGLAFTPGVDSADAMSWVLPILALAFTLIIFFGIEAYIREQIADTT